MTKTAQVELKVDECQPLVLGEVLLRIHTVAPSTAPGVGGLPLGKAVQVDPVKPTLKAPGIKSLKLNCE